MITVRPTHFSDALVVMLMLMLSVVAHLNARQYMLRAEVVSSETEVQSLTATLAKTREELVADVTALRAREKTLSAALKTEQSQTADLSEKLKASQALVEKLTREKKEAQTRLKLAGVEAEKRTEELAQLNETLSGARTRIETLETTLANLNEDMDETKSQLSAVRRERNELQGQLNDLKAAPPFLTRAKATFAAKATTAFQDDPLIKVDAAQGTVSVPALLVFSPATNDPLATGFEILRSVIKMYYDTAATLPARGSVVLMAEVHGHQEPQVDSLVPPLSARDQTDSHAMILDEMLLQQGLSPNAFVVQSMGAIKPIDTRTDEFSARSNRRIVFTLIQTMANERLR